MFVTAPLTKWSWSYLFARHNNKALSASTADNITSSDNSLKPAGEREGREEGGGRERGQMEGRRGRMGEKEGGKGKRVGEKCILRN